jgi:hypothetical protein
MAQGGFITLHRKIIGWEWYRNINTKVLFIHLLLMANYEDSRFMGKTIKRGQVVTSLPALATGTCLSIQQVRTALSHLILTGEVTDKANNQYRVITIVKYDEYQNLTDGATGNQQATNRRINRQSTDGSTPSNQYNKNNQYNKKTIIIPPSPPKGERDTDLDVWFSEFWTEYPKKVAKQNALKAWKKIKPDAPLMAAIMTSLKRWKTSYEWLRDGGRFIPYPATWLNGRRWEDEIQETRTTLPAQEYHQRDYSDEQEAAFRRMMELGGDDGAV